MFRPLIVLALAGLLVACTTQGDSTSAQPTGSGASTGAEASAAASGGAVTASAACEEAFAPVADLGLTTTSELGDLGEEVAATIEGCESVADWVAGAQQVIDGEVRPATARILLSIGCSDLSLSRTPICQEVD
jgi:hypothetical protein